MKKIIILVLVLSLYLFGCSSIVEDTNPTYFLDLNDSTLNKNMCDKLNKERCIDSGACDKVKQSFLACNKGICCCD